MDERDVLPTWWWALNGALFVVLLGAGSLRLLDGEQFSAAMFPLYALISLIAIPPVAREWKRYRRSKRVSRSPDDA